LLTLLRDRHEAGQPPLVLIPCELRERNADTLRELVLQLAAEWNFPEAVRRYVGDECTWLNTLVDRIVVNPPDGHPLTASDPMACVGEPYALWAIESRPGLPRLLEHPAVVHTPDVMPYFLRKVRILNGAHTALLIKAWPRGFRIVRDAVNDPELGAWLERLLFEEIVPTISERVAEAETFARQTLERFRNPFQEHKLADIAAHHAEKVKVRLVPTAAEHREKFGRPAVLLDEVLALPAPVIE
jgi:tagaturonate reductase